ncbi:Mur ligase family protein [Salipaludibacillus daqingensis]|uniref:Mur ligase family protein n=1 Tax=Salipaludibacillus daqingensis TaxID=3041001 RepID=UPI0024766B0D|nr:Mur ligase family protein [Salipaludibacillus daqingensis]
MFLLTVFYILLLATWILPITIKVKRSVHMLQLHSYRNEQYDKWMSINRPNTFHLLEGLYLIPLLLAIVSPSEIVVLISAIVVFALAFFVLWKNKPAENIKLVYTQQVQRLLATNYILYGVIASAAIVIGAFANIIFVFLLLIGTAVLPFYTVRLANSINSPIEKRISEGIVNDAKRLIKASPDLKIVGITGSDDKKDLKHFVHAILSTKYNVLLTPENYHTRLGVARTINEKLKHYHNIFIAEIDVKQEGDIQEICEILDHQYGILAGLDEQHLETFQTLDNIEKTQYEIVETLPEKEGVAILNKDDENIKSYQVKNQCRKVYYGIDSDNLDIQASEIDYRSKGVWFTVTLASGETGSLKTKLRGKQNVYHILAAIAIGLEMGMTLKQMIPAVEYMNPVN